ncbi:MAG: hypothetical protein ACRCS9_15475, partial [Hyphomicrobium sp.]
GPLPPVLVGVGAGGANPSCVIVDVPVPKANLALKKTALNGATCTKTGNMLDCDYDIAVTNQDAVAFNAPLTIAETVPVGATLQSLTAPWTCVGAAPNYTCDTGAAVVIPAVAAVSFTVRMSLPVAVAQANGCSVPNVAKIAVPVGGAAPNSDAADDEAEAVAALSLIDCIAPAVAPAPKDRCPDGLAMPKSGRCPCPAGARWIAKAGVCLDDDLTYDPGDEPSDEPGDDTPSSACKPARHEIATRSGRCVCDDGYSRRKGRCVRDPSGPSCEPGLNEVRIPGGACVCRSGFDRVGGRCVRDPGDETSCTPGVNEIKTPSGRCVCRDGTSRIGGYCRPDRGDDPKSCGFNEVRTPNGLCVCRSGYQRIDGRCDNPDRPEKTCPPGTRGIYPNCSTPPDARDCPRGTTGTWPNCSKITEPSCPPGTKGRYPNCTGIDIPKICPPGSRGKWPNCITLPDRQCPAGTQGRWPACKADRIPDRVKIPGKPSSIDPGRTKVPPSVKVPGRDLGKPKDFVPPGRNNRLNQQNNTLGGGASRGIKKNDPPSLQVPRSKIRPGGDDDGGKKKSRNPLSNGGGGGGGGGSGGGLNPGGALKKIF